LYDLRKDPHELNDLAADPKHKKTINRLRNQLFSWLEQRDDADPIATERAITKNKVKKPKKKSPRQ
jgi:hypothetical protein